MIAIKTLTATAAAALTLAAAGAVAAQTPYGSYPQQQQPSTQSSIVDALLGAVFGTTQTVDSEWSRGRRPIYNQRSAFDARVQAAVRDGTLTYSQSTRLRADYDGLVDLETRYAADGRITTTERADLTARYRDLTDRLQNGGYGESDGEYDWRPLGEMRQEFFARLDAGVRDRTLTRTEATRLRADFNALVQLETTYGRNGIDAREQQDLEARLAELNRRAGYDDGGYGSGGGYYDPNGRHIADIEAAIAAGERSGSIVRMEAERLRTELGDLTRLESAYVQGGLNADERAYLTRRFGELDVRVRSTRR